MALDKISHTGNYIVEACSHVAIKCIGVIGALLIDFHFGDISPSLLSALFMLILFDFVTGVWASKQAKIEIKSSKIFRTAWKFVLYFMVVSAGYFAELVIGADLFIAKTIMIFLALTELISIFENIELGGYPMPTLLIKKLKDLVAKK